MAKKRDKYWWRAYRKRKAERKRQEAATGNVVMFVNSATGERAPPAPLSANSATGDGHEFRDGRPTPAPLSTAQPIAPPVGGTEAPGVIHVAHVSAEEAAAPEIAVQPERFKPQGQPAGAQIALPRRKHMKSGKEIKSHIASSMRMYGHQPSALLHVLAGYIEQLQEDLKHDAENDFADRVCEKRHPESPAEGVYCRKCHDIEMAGRFGSLPPEFAKAGPTGHPGEELVFSSDKGSGSSQVGEEPSAEDIELDLAGIVIKKEE